MYDRWHPSRPSEAFKAAHEPCQHSTKTKLCIRPLFTARGSSGRCGTGTRTGVRGKRTSTRRRTRTPGSAIQADLQRGHYIDPQAGKETLASVGQRWLESALHKDSTAESASGAFRIHINPLLGQRSVASLKTSDIQAWVNNRSKVLSPNTVRNKYVCLRAALQSAVLDGLIAKDPCQGVKLLTVHRKEVHPLPPEVVSALVTEAPENHRVPLLVAAATGLRQGELWGLELDSVDFTKGEITVRQQPYSPDKGDPYITTLKSALRFVWCPWRRLASTRFGRT